MVNMLDLLKENDWDYSMVIPLVELMELPLERLLDYWMDMRLAELLEPLKVKRMVRLKVHLLDWMWVELVLLLDLVSAMLVKLSGLLVLHWVTMLEND